MHLDLIYEKMRVFLVVLVLCLLLWAGCVCMCGWVGAGGGMFLNGGNVEMSKNELHETHKSACCVVG